MATVTFDDLEDLGRVPVLSAVPNTVSGYKRWTIVQGPIKTEFNWYQPIDGDGFSPGEQTFVSGLAHPILAEISAVGFDLGNAASGYSVTLEANESEALFRTVTCFDVDGGGELGEGVLIKVYGY